ncbi:hypothetical protein EGJ27_24555 [Pseudomonas sp. v388]|uniref:hypothetical protein n=1 Tax=Pseudomonas sp. v388 TaxID=2479849 RepID=UPI000F76CB31|nr:hypothetical protein [Pseudomonas sp. v388]RRV03672.1 hypothetical protein EGJ27_24555 [Pseudomonas sp. v388]
MTLLKHGVVATFVTFVAMFQPLGWASEYDEGSISFAEDTTESKTCNIPYMEGDYDFKGESPDNCVNDEMSYFRLNKVPSASQFELEKRRCNESGGWVVVLSVFKNPTTTGWISIPSLKQYPEGHIVAAGVRLKEKKEIGDDDLKGELSCVRVRRSALP